MMEDKLPEDLLQAQEKINAWHKEQALKKLIGKFYSLHEGTGYPNGLRRIYLDTNDEIRVDHYYTDKHTMHKKFEFESFTISDSTVDHKQHGFREVEDPKVWYDCLKILTNIPQIKSIFVKETLLQK